MFAGLSSLTTLIISGFKQLTRIVSLPATLEHIELSGNCIKTIELDAFSLLGKLKHLNLDKNCLTADKTFPAFAHLFHLEYLSLQDNMIDSLEGLNSICLPRLRVLNLCNGKVKKLSKQMFATLPGLVNLILGNNKITEIEAGAFDGLVNLRVLNLYQNKLKEFYFNVFESAVNKLGAPVNLTDVSLYADLIIETVRWSSETTHAHEYMLIEKENQKSEADAAAGLFAKCGFRNKLDVILRTREITDQSFVNALAAMDLVRWSYH
jgi:Leucine-rich repeat (LRR) protein